MFKVKFIFSSTRLLTDFETIKCQNLINKRPFLHFSSSQDRKKVYKAEKIVNFSKDELFNLVSKTDEYYKFLPACHKSDTKYRKDNKAYVDLEVGFAPLLERYTSEVTFKEPNSVIAVSKNGKLFNNLISKWEFYDLPTSPNRNGIKPKKCLIKFEVEFEFKSKILKKIGMPFFEITAKSTLDAFIKRAQELYKT